MALEDLQSDIELAGRAAAGDEAAFNEIYANFKSLIYSLCLRMCKSPTQAEDLMQITFLQIFKKAKSYKGDSRLATWIYRLTVNQVLMEFRTSKNKVVLDSIDDPNKPVKIPFYKEPIEVRILLEDCISQLPPGYKKIFELKAEGFEHVEIGQRLGISEGTSKSQYHKARLAMQKLIKRKRNPRLVEI